MNRIDLEGRSAIVTGGASGIGLATAKRFLESGARVTLWDRSEESLREVDIVLGRLGSVRVASVDVTDFDAVSQATADADAGFGGIDILVNSAGITASPAAISDYPLSDWNSVIAVNLTGVFHCCRAIIPKMIGRGYGRVINVASMSGKEGNPQETAYAAAKAGVIAMTKSLGKEVGRAGVIVNAIAPGVLTTPMRSSKASPELVQQLLQRTALGRPGTTEEVAAVIAWMASEDCAYTTGFTFDASGGRATY